MLAGEFGVGFRDIDLHDSSSSVPVPLGHTGVHWLWTADSKYCDVILKALGYTVDAYAYGLTARFGAAGVVKVGYTSGLS